MEQTDQIKALINEGKKILREKEDLISREKASAMLKRINTWDNFIKNAKENIPIALVDYLSVDGVNFRDLDAPWNLASASRGLLQIKIDGLAPIALEFDGESRVNKYIVPEIGSFALNGDRYGWEFYSRDRVHGEEGTEVLETESMKLALAVAEKRYQLMQNLMADWRQKVAEEEAREAKVEPQYVPVEEGVDQQVMNGIRAIIREEIHKLAFE